MATIPFPDRGLSGISLPSRAIKSSPLGLRLSDRRRGCRIVVPFDARAVILQGMAPIRAAIGPEGPEMATAAHADASCRRASVVYPPRANDNSAARRRVLGRCACAACSLVVRRRSSSWRWQASSPNLKRRSLSAPRCSARPGFSRAPPRGGPLRTPSERVVRHRGRLLVNRSRRTVGRAPSRSWP